MKKIIGKLTTYAGAAILTASFASIGALNAQTPTASPAPAAAQVSPGCTPEAKLALYTEFRAIYTKEQDKAYVLAQKYLACPIAPADEAIATWLRDKFVAPMDKARRAPKVTALVYDQKDYAKAFELGRQILTEEPDNLRVLIDLGYAGYPLMLAKNDTFSAEALGYARKAIQAIESGKAPETWAPYKSKEDTLTYLYNALGQLALKSNPSEALTHLIKAAQFESELKKDPWTYVFIAAAYEAGPYTKLSADYKAKFEGKDESPESKLALENINQIIDRMVDAYARAVALAGTNPKFQTNKPAWMEGLTTWYKYRNKDSDAGMSDLIARVMSKPLPPEPTPITTLPTTTPAATVTPGSGTGAGNGVGTAAKPTATPATTTPATTTPKPATTTVTTSTTVKPKPRNHHSRPKAKRRS